MKISIKIIMITSICHFSSACTAEEVRRYIGRWAATSTYSMSVFHAFRIDEEHISWGGHRASSPECKSKYEVTDHSTLESHSDVPQRGLGSEKDKQVMYDFYKIKLLESQCARFEFMLLSFPKTNAFRTSPIYDTYFIGYHKDGKKEEIAVDVSK